MIKLFLNISEQQLYVHRCSRKIKTYQISTSKYGVGEKVGSFQTPRGLHEIYAKIGEGCPINTVFVGRKPSGEIYSADLSKKYSDRDWILTRILQLKGLETGINLSESVDTLSRHIYIHGAPDSTAFGKLQSRGCILMKNSDIIELFDLVEVHTEIFIR